MFQRVFVAFNLPPEVVSFLEEKVDELKRRMLLFEKNLRFVTPENWHITISFLGYQKSTEVVKIMSLVENVASKLTAPKIILKKLTYGPVAYKPKMIWLKTSEETSLNLGKIKKTLEDNLEEASIKFRRENRPFSGHITIARISNWGELNLPPLEETINNLEFRPESLDLMESYLKKTGAEYRCLGKFSLKN